MTTEVNAGQVRGPIQFSFARSIEPVTPIEISITRGSVTNEKDRDNERTMGRKHIVPYGLYRAHGFISARLANDQRKGTGFSDEDLDTFWQALEQMFDHDRSAARGQMNARKLLVFKHESDLGNAPAQALFDRISVKRRGPDGSLRDPEGADANQNGSQEALPPARKFGDYEVSIARDGLPSGVTLHERI